MSESKMHEGVILKTCEVFQEVLVSFFFKIPCLLLDFPAPVVSRVLVPVHST